MLSYGVIKNIYIGVGAQSTLGARHFRPKICVLKINIMPKYYIYIFRIIIGLRGVAGWGQIPPATPVSNTYGYPSISERIKCRYRSTAATKTLQIQLTLTDLQLHAVIVLK